jgi:hypothetical protein
MYQQLATRNQREANIDRWHTHQVEGITHFIPQSLVVVALASTASLSFLPKMTRQATCLVVNIT